MWLDKKNKMANTYLAFAISFIIILLIAAINFNSLTAGIPIQWNESGVTNTIDKNNFILSQLVFALGNLYLYKLAKSKKIKNTSKFANLIIAIVMVIFIISFAYILFAAI